MYVDHQWDDADWQVETEVPDKGFGLPQILYGLSGFTLASVVRSWRLTPSALYCDSVWI
jgi:hypothetical protein